MSDAFKIQVVDWLEGGSHDPVERGSFALVAITIGEQVVTELEDLFARTVRRGIRASAYDLAFWLTENWWRLRWEPEGRASDWQLSHVMAAIGGGTAWPDISFVSDGVHILIQARSTHEGRGAPVRYIRNLDSQVSAVSFEASVDDFVQMVLARLSSLGINKTELKSLWEQLVAERSDERVSVHRRLEALMGFDAEEAPETLIASLEAHAVQVGKEAVDEMAAATKARAPETIEQILEQARSSNFSIRVESASNIQPYLGRSDEMELPWQRAERAAESVRHIWGVGEGPISNSSLSELLGFPKQFLEYTAADGVPVAAGLRTEREDTLNVVLRAKMQHGRRFEVMRLVADHIVAHSDEHLLPATRAKTDRQKFQRAFAQEFLLPFREIQHRLPPDQDIGADDIEDIASEYDVSPLLVRTLLVNRQLLPRDALHTEQ